MALCSESTGRIVALIAAASIRNAPAVTIDSLLAIAIMPPRRIAASVGASPAMPVMAETVISAGYRQARQQQQPRHGLQSRCRQAFVKIIKPGFIGNGMIGSELKSNAGETCAVTTRRHDADTELISMTTDKIKRRCTNGTCCTEQAQHALFSH